MHPARPPPIAARPAPVPTAAIGRLVKRFVTTVPHATTVPCAPSEAVGRVAGQRRTASASPLVQGHARRAASRTEPSGPSDGSPRRASAPPRGASRDRSAIPEAPIARAGPSPPEMKPTRRATAPDVQRQDSPSEAHVTLGVPQLGVRLVRGRTARRGLRAPIVTGPFGPGVRPGRQLPVLAARPVSMTRHSHSTAGPGACSRSARLRVRPQRRPRARAEQR